MSIKASTIYFKIGKVQLFILCYDWTGVFHSVSADKRPTASGFITLRSYVRLTVLITYLHQAPASRASFQETCWQPHGAATQAKASHVWGNKGCEYNQPSVSLKMNEEPFCFFCSAQLMVEVLIAACGTVAASGFIHEPMIVAFTS